MPAYNSKRKYEKKSRRRSRSPKYPELGHFTLSFYRRTAKKCTKNYNARAQLLFCSLNLLFCGVLVAVVVCLRSLVIKHGGHLRPRGKCFLHFSISVLKCPSVLSQRNTLLRLLHWLYDIDFTRLE